MPLCSSENASGPLCNSSHTMRSLISRSPLRSPRLAHPQLFGCAIALAVFGLLGGRPRLWHEGGPTILFGSTTALVLLGVAGCIASFLQWRIGHSGAFATPPRNAVSLATGAALTFIGVFLSDWLVRGQSLFKGPFCRPEAFVVAAVVWYAMRQSRVWQRNGVLFLPVIGSLLALTSFLIHADGRTIVADDHAVFIYRLQLLKEQFPHIPFYYPLWNGGIDARDFFASGSLNVFFLFFPIIATCDIWQCYTVIVGLSVFVLPPLSIGGAARILRCNRPTAAIAATLAIAPSLLWYRWGLKYGTMGFVVSTALAPLCWALWFQVAQSAKLLSWRLLISTLIVTTLVAFWSLAPIAIAPVALAFILDGWRGLLRPRLMALFAALLAINLPWMLLFVTVSRVTSFIGAEQSPMTTVATSHEISEKDQPATSSSVLSSTIKSSTTLPEQRTLAFRHRSGGISLKKAVHHLRSWGISANPLLFIFGPVGILLLNRRLGLLYSLQCLWLLGIGTLLISLKPQLELDRMLVVLATFLCIPAAIALRALMRPEFLRSERPEPRALRWQRRLAKGGTLLACSFIVLTPLYGCFVSQNRSIEHTYFSGNTYAEILRTIEQHPGPGRILFSGQVLHELDQGHFAPLTILTRRPMIASSQVHNLWSYKQVIPADFISRGDEGIEEYLNLMNVSLVFAHDPVWRRWFQDRPGRYTPVLKGPPFAAFTRHQNNHSYFIEGAGTITRQDTKSVTFVPSSSEGVLSFTWFPFLESSRCTISSYPVGKEVTLIRFAECTPGEPVTISAGSPIRRLLHR